MYIKLNVAHYSLVDNNIKVRKNKKHGELYRQTPLLQRSEAS